VEAWPSVWGDQKILNLGDISKNLRLSLQGPNRFLECPGKLPLSWKCPGIEVSRNVLENYNCPGKVSLKMGKQDQIMISGSDNPAR